MTSRAKVEAEAEAENADMADSRPVDLDELAASKVVEQRRQLVAEKCAPARAHQASHLTFPLPPIYAACNNISEHVGMTHE